MLDKYYVGDIDPSTFKVTQVIAPPPRNAAATDNNNPGFLVKVLQLLVPIIVLGLAIVMRKYTKSD